MPTKLSLQTNHSYFTIILQSTTSKMFHFHKLLQVDTNDHFPLNIYYTQNQDHQYVMNLTYKSNYKFTYNQLALTLEHVTKYQQPCFLCP